MQEDRKIFVTTFPKTGTHLLWHILGFNKDESQSMALRCTDRLIGLRVYNNGLTGHLPFCKQTMDLARYMEKYTLIRDPRDAIVSLSYYYNDPKHDFAFGRLWGCPDFRGAYDRKMLLIEVVHQFFMDYVPWLDIHDMHILRYEDLMIDPEKALASYTHIAPLDELVRRAKFRGTETFRKGLIGEWRHEFAKRHKQRFDELYGNVMRAWGYE